MTKLWTMPTWLPARPLPICAWSRAVLATPETPKSEAGVVVQALLKHYCDTSHLNEGNETEGGQREAQAGDSLVLMAAHVIRGLARRSSAVADQGDVAAAASRARQQRQWLTEAAVLLEEGLKRSPYCFRMQVLLCQIYGALGAAAPAIAQVNALAVDTFSSTPSDGCSLTTLAQIRWGPAL